jgi:hypothetical protein
MAKQTTTKAVAARKHRGRMGLVWSGLAALAVIVLIYTEQIALLYVLATLSVTALLVVVALADLGDARRVTQPPPFDDSAAAGDAMNSAAASAAPRASARR